MASETKQWLVLCLLLLATSCMQYCVQGKPQVNCIYAFGDSLTDVGNNNYVTTISKANFRPYGIDFQYGPTGRFTNNQTQFDIIVRKLRFPNYPPPYQNTSGSNITKGVNYAYGGAGILYDSGLYYGQRNFLGAQVNQHTLIVSQIAKMFGGFPKAILYLKKCIYYMNIGTNDYAVNYLLPNSTTSRIFTPDQYAESLIAKYYIYIKILRAFGARKFVVNNLIPLGCAPIFNSNGSCNATINGIVDKFNVKLKTMVDKCNKELDESKCIYVNVSALYPTPTHPRGFTNTTGYCCPVNDLGFCKRNSRPCPNRNDIVSYDLIHTTDATNKVIANAAYKVLIQSTLTQ